MQPSCKKAIRLILIISILGGVYLFRDHYIPFDFHVKMLTRNKDCRGFERLMRSSNPSEQAIITRHVLELNTRESYALLQKIARNGNTPSKVAIIYHLKKMPETESEKLVGIFKGDEFFDALMKREKRID